MSYILFGRIASVDFVDNSHWLFRNAEFLYIHSLTNDYIVIGISATH